MSFPFARALARCILALSVTTSFGTLAKADEGLVFTPGDDALSSGWTVPGTLAPDRASVEVGSAETADLRQAFAVFVEVFKYFVETAREFEREQVRGYASIGDFRASFVRRLGGRESRESNDPHVPPGPLLLDVSLEIQAYRATTRGEELLVKSEGVGAGLRVDVRPSERGTFSVSVLPVYFERRAVRSEIDPARHGVEYLARASLGLGYHHELGERVEPGVQLYLQPQLLDFREVRMYAEAYVRFKLLVRKDKGGSAGPWGLSEVSLVPKLIYWRSTDSAGVINRAGFGDPVGEIFGDSLLRLDSNLYGFVNLELRFSSLPRRH